MAGQGHAGHRSLRRLSLRCHISCTPQLLSAPGGTLGGDLPLIPTEPPISCPPFACCDPVHHVNTSTLVSSQSFPIPPASSTSTSGLALHDWQQ